MFDVMNVPRRVLARLRRRCDSCLERNVFFLHMPKCGGTSVEEAVGSLFDRSSRFQLQAEASTRAASILGRTSLDYRRELLVYVMSSMERRRSSYISGHFGFSQAAYDEFGCSWAYITMLRNPVDRWFSNYFYNRYKPGSHARIDDDLPRFLESDRAAAEGRMYIRFLLENAAEETCDVDCASEAVQVLSKFQLVGCLERMNHFVSRFEELFGARLTIERKNVNPMATHRQSELVSEAVRRRVEELCRPDLYVYNHVLATLDACE